MKKLGFLLLALVSLSAFAQKKHAGVLSSTQADTTQVKSSKYSKYISVGLSMSSGNTYDTNENKYTFSESSYPSVEFGVTRENLSLGVIVGRGNFKGAGSKTDNLGNYYGELKVSPSFPLGVVSANLIFGVGSYFNDTVGGTFIEYGSGISYTSGKFTYGVNYSNWDGIDYITPCLTYSL